MSDKMSNTFNINFKFLKIFAIWPDKNNIQYYQYYSFVFLFTNLFVYNIFLTLNLVYTPWEIDLLIREIIFYFTEVAVTAKVFMILLMRKKILQAFDILDCEAFKGGDDTSRQIVEEHVSTYKTWWKMCTILSNFSYSSQVFYPLFAYFILSNARIGLPICKYYFLNTEFISQYFWLLYVYQSVGMYAHLQYNVNVDSLMDGFILMAIGQVKVLNLELRSLGSTKDHTGNDMKFIKCINHYQILLQYCSEVQDIISVTMFVQFSMAALIICVVLCGLTLPSSVETFIFMIGYLIVMVSQIFVPAWLGTRLRYESQELVFAMYSSHWVQRPLHYQSTLKLFMQRTNRDISFYGWKMFPLSLDTFISIIKMAYSFFTLIRNVQNRQVSEKIK